MKSEMMKEWSKVMNGVIAASVDWHHGFMNEPTLKLLVDRLPTLSERRFSCKQGVYYSDYCGIVSFYYYKSPGEGFGGREFKLIMEDNTEKVLKGPWSSNSTSVNSLGFGPCMEVSITEKPEVWERGHTFYGSAVTVDLAQKAVDEFLPDIYLIRGKYDGYCLSLSPTEVVKPQEEVA